MALVYDSSMMSLGLQGWLNKAQRAVASFFVPSSPYSPEADLLSGHVRDQRLVPRAPMSGANIDVGLQTQLSSIGLKRAKEVTDESHPELMAAWRLMAQRAGLPRPPQLIIAESPSLNALTIEKDEVTITTGLLRILDLRETVAVLGHELGHVESDHVTPRAFWNDALRIGGIVGGAELGRQGALNRTLNKLGEHSSVFRKLHNWRYGPERLGHPSSTLGSLLYMGAGATIGGVAANHIAVRSTELDADAKSAAISGDPIGLAMGLKLLQEHTPSGNLKTRWYRFSSGYPSTENRIAKLYELAQQQPMVPVLAELEARQAQAAVAPVGPVVGQPRMAVSDITGAERVGEISGPALT